MDTFLRWFMAVFMSVVLLCILALIASTAQATDVPPTAAEPAEITQGAIIIGIDKVPQVVIFISSKGNIQETGINDCMENVQCKTELGILIKNDKVDFINISTAKKGDLAS